MSKQEILAVEDDENILELVKYNLVKEGYDVYCVPSGEEALTAARSQLPHLLVLDLMLPGVDGLEHGKHLIELMKKAIEHRGFALIDIFSPCVTFNHDND